MKLRHQFFLILKLLILIQFTLIFFNKESIDDTTYILTKIIFKTSEGIYIEYLMFHANDNSNLMFEDKVVLSFAGGLLMYDAWVNNLPQLLTKYNKKIVLYPIPSIHSL